VYNELGLRKKPRSF